MALTRQDVVVSCVVAFFSWTILSHLLPALRLVPYAFFAGVLATLAGFLYIVIVTTNNGIGTHQHASSRTSPLAFTAPNAWRTETTLLKQRQSYRQSLPYTASSLVTPRLNKLIDLIIRDFIKSWYNKISNGSNFSNEVDNAIREAIRRAIAKFQPLNLSELGVVHILPIINSHIKSFADAERAVRGKNRDIADSEELDSAIAAKYREGRVHPATSVVASDTIALQQHHLRRVVGRLLAELLPETMTTSNAVLIMVRELVACAVVSPVLQMLADPDTVNQLIEAYGRSVLRERKSIRKLREALEEHASPKSKNPKKLQIPQLSPNDSERAFERFIRAIRQCTNLSEARRYRSQISSQSRRHSSLNGRDTTYLRRLEIGKRLLDERISHLSSQPSSPTLMSRPKLPQSYTVIHTRENSSLRQILYDTSGLSYFMEFMDRVKLMSLVQFWIVVDGFRNPLDQDTGDSRQPLHAWTELDVQDLLQIHDAYLRKPELKTAAEARKAVGVFLGAGQNASSGQYSAARRAVLKVQDDVFAELNSHYFDDFRKSDLYYTWLNTEEPIASPAASLGQGHEEFLSPMLSAQKLSTHVKAKNTDLRRAVASSTDLLSSVARSEKDQMGRRSLDLTARRPLFGDDLDADEDDDPLATSTHSLDSSAETNERSLGERENVVAAVQAALDDIVDGKTNDRLGLGIEIESDDETKLANLRGQIRKPRTESISQALEREKPSLDSLGLLGGISRPSVFIQGDLFGEEEKLWEEDIGGSQLPETDDNEAVQEAAPGDLGLAELVQSLSLDIAKLEAQQSVLDSLTAKAELTNNIAELRILRKSKTSLEREIHRKELQRQHYIVQESDSTLYGKASIFIKSIMVGTEEDGHEYALYVIEVQRQAGEKSTPVTWAIMRRYSEFYDLYKRLRARYPSVRDLEFPKKQMVFTLQKDFLRKRRSALERYLRDLLTYPAVCRSIEFRAFLSQQTIRPLTAGKGGGIDRQDFITRIYSSVTDGMEEFLGNIPVLDQLSLAGQNIINAASYASPHATINPSVVPSAYATTPAQAAEAQDEINAFQSNPKGGGGESDNTRFITPICDIFLEVFQLHQGQNWLRGRALVVVLQQLLGGTIERKIRDMVRSSTTEESVARYIGLLTDAMWPGGTFRTSPPARTAAEKAASKREAGLVLATLVPDLAGGVVGRSNAAKAGRRIFATLNNPRLNQHLVYTLLDEMIDATFGFRVQR